MSLRMSLPSSNYALAPWKFFPRTTGWGHEGKSNREIRQAIMFLHKALYLAVSGGDIVWGYSLILLMEEIPNKHLGCVKPCQNNGINYQPQLVVYPSIYMVLLIPDDPRWLALGFQPSTV